MSKLVQAHQGPLAAPRGHPWRHLAAVALRCASLGLARLARRLSLARAPYRPQPVPELEFYAEAGAPEGALYLNGEYIGSLPGVSRL